MPPCCCAARSRKGLLQEGATPRVLCGCQAGLGDGPAPRIAASPCGRRRRSRAPPRPWKPPRLSSVVLSAASCVGAAELGGRGGGTRGTLAAGSRSSSRRRQRSKAFWAPRGPDCWPLSPSALPRSRCYVQACPGPSCPASSHPRARLGPAWQVRSFKDQGAPGASARPWGAGLLANGSFWTRS